MQVLITGANGFLGQHLCSFLRNTYDVTGTGKGEKRIPFDDVAYRPGDISCASDLQNIVLEVQPEVIIHTAAMSRPDECNTNRDICDKVNIEGTRNVINAAASLKSPAHIIYTSTDFVFGDGGPHDEDALPAPLNYYGESKLKAEKIVEQSKLSYTIVRPVFMYGETWEGMRATFLHWAKQSLEKGTPIKVVCDQRRTPSYVVDICKGIQAIIDRKAQGLYHLAGEEILSPYDMAMQMASFLKLDASFIEPVTAETFNEPVRRAREGGVLIGKAKKELDYQPVSFAEGLRLTFGE